MRGTAAIIELEDEIEIDNTPLDFEPKDIRARHCKTAQELALFKYSSNYQTIRGGNSDLQHELGIYIDHDSMGADASYA